MRIPYVAGNWKMHTDRAEARALAEAVGKLAEEYAGRVRVGIAPPSVWLAEACAAAGDAAAVLGQTCSAHASGAHTGEVSAPMLVSAGAAGVLVGHSERRQLYGESPEDTAAKLAAARGTGLEVILCVGETLDEREAGRTWDVVGSQLAAAVVGREDDAGLTVAYEPVWAIGTGKTATPEQAQDVHARIRAWWAERFGGAASAALRIQYGGSVKPGNAAELLAQPDIDGALVGGASLDIGSFSAIVSAAAS